MPAIQARDVVQRRGHRQVLRGVSFDISHGVVGLLGPNGAGKTTLLETICTILQLPAGSLTVLGLSVSQRSEVWELRRRIGYLPQTVGFVPSFSARDFVEYVAWSKGVASNRIRPAAGAALDEVGMADAMTRKLRTLSGGMIRRVGIAAAIAHEPELLVLDEPTAGLDPEQRAEFRRLVKRIGERTPVMVSTHLTDDVDAMCAEVIVIDHGRIVYQGATVGLAAQAETSALGDTPLERGYISVIRDAKAGASGTRSVSTPGERSTT